MKYTNYEKKIRKQWVICRWIYFALVGVLLLIGEANETLNEELIFTSLLYFGIFWLTYHCAYKKHGTILITLQMIGAPIVFLSNSYKYGIDYIDLLTVIAFTYTNARLININAKIQKREKENDILDDQSMETVDAS